MKLSHLLSFLSDWHFQEEGEKEMNSGRPIYNPDQKSTYQFDAPFFGPPERSFETKKPRTISDYKDAAVDTDRFLGYFYEFNDEEAWPRKLIEICYKRARMYVTAVAQCDQLDGEDREFARALFTAHLCVLTKKAQMQTNQAMANKGAGGGGVSGIGQLGGSGILTSASVGGVNVSMTIPQSANAWEFFLNQTPYGIEYQAFISSHVPVGIYSNGDDLRLCLRD